MEFEKRQRHMYIRNAVICFGCTAVCVATDIWRIVKTGNFVVNRQQIVSMFVYVILVFMGIRAVKKVREIGKK